MAQANYSIPQKPYFAEGTDAMIALEGMIDVAGLRNVVWALAHIRWEKGDHVRTNWQDDQLAVILGQSANAAMLDSFAAKLRCE